MNISNSAPERKPNQQLINGVLVIRTKLFYPNVHICRKTRQSTVSELLSLHAKLRELQILARALGSAPPPSDKFSFPPKHSALPKPRPRARQSQAVITFRGTW